MRASAYFLLYTACFAFGMLISRCAPKDDTDPPDGRSGMVIYTDHLTGCQYLARPLGGVTPRLDAQGRQLGCRP